MKVLLIGKSSKTGGAAIASVRLMQVLKENGVEVNMLVQDGEDLDSGIFSTTHSALKRGINFLRFVLERLTFLRHEKSKDIRFLFSLANTGEGLARNPHVREADIIHLHWINGGFLSLASLEQIFRLGKPVVWTLHDMWPFTGGCHHALDCDAYMRKCGQCIYLKKPGEKDLSFRLWTKKVKLFKDREITLITPSKWMKDCVGASALLGHQEIFAIHNAVDQSLFKPADRELSCRNLGLDPSKKYILFGAASVKNLYKGFRYFQEAIALLYQDPARLEGVEIILFGKGGGDLSALFPVKTHCIDFVSSMQTMTELYSMAHLLVISSLQDNFPSTLIESMLCGTPVVGFRTGGIPEMIVHLEDGYLAEHKSASDLAEGMLWILSHTSYQDLSTRSRKAAQKRFSSKVAAEKHISLYHQLLDKTRKV
jgi:glycosyltransferase involved in cell wall biosynthesis